MGKELGGIPLWIYLAGAAVVVGGYLYITHSSGSSSSSAPSGGTGNTAAPGTSTSSFKETITDLQSKPKKTKKKKAA
jgi:hypothetical protein